MDPQMTSRTAIAALLTCVMGLLLFACGGSSGSASNSAGTIATTPSRTKTADPVAGKPLQANRGEKERKRRGKRNGGDEGGGQPQTAKAPSSRQKKASADEKASSGPSTSDTSCPAGMTAKLCEAILQSKSQVGGSSTTAAPKCPPGFDRKQCQRLSEGQGSGGGTPPTGECPPALPAAVCADLAKQGVEAAP